jgi:hypothetical protein
MRTTSFHTFHGSSFVIVGFGALLAGLAATAACSSGNDGDPGMSSPNSDAGPTNCTPKPGPDVPDESFADSNCDGIDGEKEKAVFVSPAGIDSAPGSMIAPVQTLTQAVRIAQATGKDVYVCSATYPESLLIENTGIRIYGGYDCAKQWARTTALAVVSPLSGKPLRAKNVRSLYLEGLHLKAPNGFQFGESAIAAVIQDSASVVLKRSILEAGDGAKGRPGESPEALTKPVRDGVEGESVPKDLCSSPSAALCINWIGKGGQGQPISCFGVATSFIAGRGGNSGNHPLAGNPELRGGDANPGPARGGEFVKAREFEAYGIQNVGTAQPGQSGKDQSQSPPGKGSEEVIGTIVNGDYEPSKPGGDGTPGIPGTPGGGGAGRLPIFSNPKDGDPIWLQGGAGGEGGPPGCGGAPGRGGGGGGASIALLTIDSAVELESVKLRTGKGGDGGDPSDGANGQPGGGGGKGGDGPRHCVSPTACLELVGGPGGKGGNGGKGGAGGSGAGGPSIGIFAQGELPRESSMPDYELGSAGESGKVLASSGTPAKPGLSLPHYQLAASP